VNGRRRNLSWVWVLAIAVVILATQVEERHWAPALVQLGIMAFLVLRFLQHRRRPRAAPEETEQAHPAPSATLPDKEEDDPEPVEAPAPAADDDQWKSIWDDPAEGGSVWDEPKEKEPTEKG
jgi:hypothetical protein